MQIFLCRKQNHLNWVYIQEDFASMICGDSCYSFYRSVSLFTLICVDSNAVSDVSLKEHKDRQDLDLIMWVFSVATFGPQVLQHLLTLTSAILFFQYINFGYTIFHWQNQYSPWSKIHKFFTSAKFLTQKNDRIRAYVSNQLDLGTLIYLDLFVPACPH